MNKTIYKYILEILKEGSFSKAADNLYISQPSLSRSIIDLENRLGVKIFDRSKKYIVLTPAGERLVSYIEKSQQLEMELLSDLEAMKKLDSQAINVGVISWKLPVFLPRIIQEFKNNYPNVEINMSINHSVKLEGQLVKDDLDVAIINGPANNKSLEYLELYSSNIIIIANNDSKLVKRLNISKENKADGNIIHMKDIEHENFILLRENTRFGQLSRNILHHYYGAEPKNIIDVANVNSAINMVSIGMGLSFIPDLFVKSGSIDQDNTCYFSIDKSNFKMPLWIIFKKDKAKEPNIKNFIDFVYQNYKT